MVTAGLLLAAGPANAQKKTTADYFLCTAHMERASMNLIMERPADAAKELEGAKICHIGPDDPREWVNLDAPQLIQLSKVVALMAIQLKAPTANVHMQLTDEIGVFIWMLD